MSSSSEPGFVRGKHYTELVDTVKRLMQSGSDEAAEKILLEIVEAVEAEAAVEKWPVAPWYYEQLARIYRDARRFDDERAILERLLAGGASIDNFSEQQSRRLIELRNAAASAAGGAPAPATPSATSRLAITKKHLTMEAGAELLSLCQTVTEDGSISDDEVGALRDWLQRNRDAVFPAQLFLNATVERILADGKVTDDERAELYRALEAVLPTELRKDAVRRKQATKPKEAEPVDVYDFMVAGWQFEGRPETIRRDVVVDDIAYLIRDRANRHSRNAVAVRSRHGSQIGFVPETDARALAPLLDRGYLHVAWVKKILSGGKGLIPVVCAEIYEPDAKVPRAVSESAVPGKRSTVTAPRAVAATDPKPDFVEEERPLGPLGWTVLVAIAAVVILSLFLALAK